MKRARWIILALLLPLVAWLGGAVLPGCAYDVTGGLFGKDFSRRPPWEAFEYTFHRRPPPDVTDLYTAGEAWMGGTSVWLRFRASETTIRDLVSGYKRLAVERKELRNFSEMWDPTLRRFDPADRLRWKKLYAVPKLDCFKHTRGDGGSTTVWVDRRTGAVYVFLFGDSTTVWP